MLFSIPPFIAQASMALTDQLVIPSDNQQQFSVTMTRAFESLRQSAEPWPDLDDDLLFLRTFSYQFPVDKLSEETLRQLHQLLIALTQHKGFFKTHTTAQRWQEQFSVLSYRYYQDGALQPLWSELSPSLQRISSTLPTGGLAADYAWWEAIRAQSFLAFTARSTDHLKTNFNQPAYRTTLLRLLEHAEEWQLEHLLWLLAYQHILLPEKAQQQLDQAVMLGLSNHTELNRMEQKRLFSQRYLPNSFRVRDICLQEFSDWCLLPEINKALPLRHHCHEALIVRYKTISSQKLTDICSQMVAQEDSFHNLLQTGRQPVANDFNSALEVIVFDDYSDYNLYGALHFNIRTNNGGMYIEGTPSDPANQARFFAFQRFWQPKPFTVWNLEHEYIHYLDGRYASYGPFGHFPSHKVWWSEGLAELISLGKHNPRAISQLHATSVGAEPTLAQIFSASYQDGLDLTYRWSYLAWRYLQATTPETIPPLAHALKTDFFQSYQAQLNQLAEQHQTQFVAFLQQLRHDSAEQQETDELPYLGRYLYRSYLQPAHLPVTARHYHRLTLDPQPENTLR